MNTNNDPKAIVQQYLIDSGADIQVLNAFRDLDEREQRQVARTETAIREQREMAETVIRAALGEYPAMAITPWLEALASLVAEREAANWLAQEIDDYNVLVTMAKRLMADEQISHAAQRVVEGYLLQDGDCDHPVGVCVCELKSALGYDCGDSILFPRNVNSFVSRMHACIGSSNTSATTESAPTAASVPPEDAS